MEQAPVPSLQLVLETRLAFSLLLSILNLSYSQPLLRQILVAFLLVEPKPSSQRGVSILLAPGLLCAGSQLQSGTRLTRSAQVDNLNYTCAHPCPHFVKVALLLTRVNHF